MSGKGLVITEFLTASKPINYKGDKFDMKKRTSSALIFPIHGKLKFSWGSEVIFADPGHPVFIYEEMSYTNTCIEDAQSIMFNVKVQNNEEKIIQLLPPDKDCLQRIYEEITVLNINFTARKHSKIFEKLYQLIGESLPYEPGDSTSILSPVLEVVEKSYYKKELTLEKLAESCHISKSYLHKLFKKEYGMTPFQYITQTRMTQAKMLLLEMFPVGVVASMVGYSDIYQFSRAFKRFYKISPDKFRFLQKPM